MNKKTLISICCGFTVGLAGAVAATTNIPNLFHNGDTASASAVNQDFSALGAAIDTLAARIATLEGGAGSAETPQFHDANDVVVGQALVGVASFSTPWSVLFKRTDHTILQFGIDTQNGLVPSNFQLQYTSTDCSGTPYATSTGAQPGIQGSARDAAGAWYGISGAKTTVTAQSVQNANSGASCQMIGSPGPNALYVTTALTSAETAALNALAAPFTIKATPASAIPLLGAAQ